MTDPTPSLETISALLAPFNDKDVAITLETSFSTDLELDSLAVMDFVAEMEDTFDIMIPLNILPDLETVGEVVDAVIKIVSETHG